MREKLNREIERKPGRGSRPFAIRTLTAAAVIAGFLGGAVVTDGVQVYVSDSAAFAKGGNGGGNGGGKGGDGRGSGHGGGNKGAHGDVAGAAKARGHAKGHGHGHKSGLEHIDGHDHSQGHGRGHAKGHGHARGEEEGNGRSDPPGAPSLDGSASENGISAAALGSLNAAHASAKARENASPNSMVGHIADFADAVESNEIDRAAAALAAKSNKSITPEVVTEVARLAEVEVSEDTAGAIAEAAAEMQSDNSREPTDQSMPGGS